MKKRGIDGSNINLVFILEHDRFAEILMCD
jgi:hypothetical protein